MSLSPCVLCHDWHWRTHYVGSDSKTSFSHQRHRNALSGSKLCISMCMNIGEVLANNIEWLCHHLYANWWCHKSVCGCSWRHQFMLTSIYRCRSTGNVTGGLDLCFLWCLQQILSVGSICHCHQLLLENADKCVYVLQYWWWLMLVFSSPQIDCITF